MSTWDDVENATWRAVVLASGLAPEKVVWSYQNFNEKNHSYIRMNYGSIIPVGQDYTKQTVDLTRVRGQEIEIAVIGLREMPLLLECFTSDTIGAGAARQILERTRTALVGLSSIRAVLHNEGIAVFDLGTVDYIPEINGTNFRGRAVCTLRCYLPSKVTEYVGYIERVTGTIYPRGSGASGIPFDTDDVGEL